MYAWNDDGTFVLPAHGKDFRELDPQPPVRDSATGMTAPLSWPHASPDGSMWIGVVLQPGSLFGVWTYSPSSGTYTRALDAAAGGDWGPPFIARWVPGQPNVVLANDGGQLVSIDLARRQKTAVSLPKSVRRVGAFTMTSDGRTLLVVEPSNTSLIWLMR
jgi:hypothetical protein